MAKKGPVTGEQILTEVKEMLETVYRPSDPPDFEVKEVTVDILHQVATKLKAEEKANNAQVKYYNNLADEYSAKSKELADILQAIGMSSEDITNDIESAANALASVACILDLKEPTSTNFLLGMNHFAREQLSVSEERTQVLRKQEKLTKKLNLLLEKIDKLEKDASSSEQKQKEQAAQEAKRSTTTKFLSDKKHVYQKKVTEQAQILKLSGYDPSVSHSVLVKYHEDLKELEKELNTICLTLESYRDLPPDENLAKIEIEKAKQELSSLEQQMQKEIQLKISSPHSC